MKLQPLRQSVSCSPPFCSRPRCPQKNAQTAAPSADQRMILTPKPGPQPRINGPRLFGVRPGRPFLYRIPCTGERPIAFAVGRSSRKDSASITGSGIITGNAPSEQPGKYVVKLNAKNEHGAANKEFTIVVGDKLALTPPMGWNSWYTWYHTITDKKMRQAADQMVATGMADVGYMYVSIDDCWMMQSPEGYEVRKVAAARPGRQSGGRQDSRAQWRVSDQCQLPRHAGDDRLHSRQRPASRHLHVAGAAHVPALRGKLSARATRRRAVRGVGIRLPEVRLVHLRRRLS